MMKGHQTQQTNTHRHQPQFMVHNMYVQNQVFFPEVLRIEMRSMLVLDEKHIEPCAWDGLGYPWCVYMDQA